MSLHEKRMSRRTLVAGAAGAMAVAGVSPLASIANADETNKSSSQTTYAAVAPSMKGDITVFVTMDGDEIVGLSVLDEVDTPVIRDAAIKDVSARVIEQQNLEVDATAGATVTSTAILQGALDALTNGGVDTSAFKKGSDAPKKESGTDEQHDIVIVGSGMAGLSAALYVKKTNEEADVIVIEKQAYTGGSTRVCGGGIWAVGAGVNETIGQDCSFEDYLSFMQARSQPDEINADLLKNIHDISGEMFDYLYSWGFPVSIANWGFGNPDAQVPVFNATACQQTTDWETGNNGLVDFLEVLARNQGVEIRTNCKATEILVEDGCVVGIAVEDRTSSYSIHSDHVILASGGFTRNQDLIAQYAPDYTDAFAFTGSGSTGDGIQMATKLGATIVGTGMMGLSGLNPNLGYYGPRGSAPGLAQLTVNAEGVDFGMKGTFYGDTLALLLSQTGACGYGISDATNENVDRLDQAVEAGFAGKYDTLEALASDQGIDAEALVQTAQENGIQEAPFYCMVRRPLFIGSIPGVKVDADCHVLGDTDQPIAGLYAAGEVMFGNAFSQAYPCSGTGVGTSCYTGAIAARSALNELSS